MKMNIDLDTVTGLVLEFAESHNIHVKIVKDMEDAYDTRNPTAQEKLQFLREVLPLLPKNSYVTDIVREYLVLIDSGEEEERNAVIKKVVDYLLEDGGLVTVYSIKSTALDTFFVVTFDDGDDEVVWGCSDMVEDALRVAEREWDKFNHDEGPDENPFTQALKQNQS